MRTFHPAHLTLLLFSAAPAYHVVTFGPNFHFQDGFKLSSFGFEIGYWKKFGTSDYPLYGYDVGCELFRAVRYANQDKSRRPPEGKFKRNFRVYGEYQMGGVPFGASAGPFVEFSQSVQGMRVNPGIQSTLWTWFFVGADLRPTLSLQGLGFSYGPFFRLGECNEPCL